eukprot:CAMPEP_0197054932 /NCGR_PEP_ID=MMETSP1384-20130603/53206_1 /TAXON_ID=29189 /ORGANISM="Ammonia sp." /LENGTH=59 /DNA_ID=CAMNT_0042488299 /DNA_START=78 /DNA_END=257 /DNA_ORIENTATION=-
MGNFIFRTLLENILSGSSCEGESAQQRMERNHGPQEQMSNDFWDTCNPIRDPNIKYIDM